MRCVLPHLLVAAVAVVLLLGTTSAFSLTSFGSKVLSRSRMQLFASTAETESTYESKFNPRDDVSWIFDGIVGLLRFVSILPLHDPLQ